MKRIYLFNVFIFIGLIVVYMVESHTETTDTTIPVGILFSDSGTMANSERPVLRATLLAINEINQQGGIDGKWIEPIIYDAESNLDKYSFLAKKMIVDDHVKAIFGCWTSASRKIVKPIVEQYNNLLIYPTQTEGVEESNNIIYLGAIPNQQLIPAAYWMLTHYGKRAYLVGSDFISPYVENAILMQRITLLGGEILGEKYIPLGSMAVDDVVQDIIEKKPDVIFSIINGSSNVPFFKRLYELTTEKGIKRPKVMTFSLPAAAINQIGMDKIEGDLAAWSYFISEDNPENRAFLKAYSQEYGSLADMNDPAATAYSGVYLWAQAASQAPSLQANAIRDYMVGQSVASPMGVIYVDPSSAYAWRTVEIAHIHHQHYDIVWRSEAPIEPVVYPDFKSKIEWAIFEYNFYTHWKK